jgi:hypothetical protein
MDQHLMEGRYYQFVGKVREWLSDCANLNIRQQEIGAFCRNEKE